MKSNVTYDRDMRERACREGKGLVTIQILYPIQRTDRNNGGITFQGPADAAELKRVTDFFIELSRSRSAASGAPAGGGAEGKA